MKFPNVTGLFKLGKAAVAAHRPEILFGTSIVSTIGAVVMAAKGGYEARGKVEEAELQKALYILPKDPSLSDYFDAREDVNNQLTVKEKIQETWLCYLPAAGLTTAALGSTTGLHLVHVKEKKAIAAAALMAIDEVREQGKQYADDVVKTLDEKLPAKKADDVKEAIEDKQSARAIEADQLYLVRDEKTGRSFYGTENRMQSAINEVNRMLQSRDVSLNDFYVWAGVQELKDGEELGWNSGDFITLSWDDDHLEDGRPVRAFTFHSGPTRGYDSTHR